jgi:hypothetical protein
VARARVELPAPAPNVVRSVDLNAQLDALLTSPNVHSLLLAVLDTDTCASAAGNDVATHDALRALPALRRLRTSL